MFKDEIIEMFYTNKRAYRIPVLFLSESIKAIEEVLEKINEEEPYASLSRLFDE